MEDLLLILVTGLMAVLIMTIGVLAWMGHRFLRLKEMEKNLDRGAKLAGGGEAPAKKPRPKVSADILKALRSEQAQAHYCVDHPDMMTAGICAISGESFCEHCLTKQKDIRVAKKYLDLYLDSEWVEVAMLPNDGISQDAAERIVKVKEELWQSQARPMIVQGHFKINVQSDQIEAFTVIIARKDDSDFIRKELSFIQ